MYIVQIIGVNRFFLTMHCGLLLKMSNKWSIVLTDLTVSWTSSKPLTSLDESTSLNYAYCKSLSLEVLMGWAANFTLIFCQWKFRSCGVSLLVALEIVASYLIVQCSPTLSLLHFVLWPPLKRITHLASLFFTKCYPSKNTYTGKSLFGCSMELLMHSCVILQPRT